MINTVASSRLLKLSTHLEWLLVVAYHQMTSQVTLMSTSTVDPWTRRLGVPKLCEIQNPCISYVCPPCKWFPHIHGFTSANSTKLGSHGTVVVNIQRTVCKWTYAVEICAVQLYQHPVQTGADLQKRSTQCSLQQGYYVHINDNTTKR